MENLPELSTKTKSKMDHLVMSADGKNAEWVIRLVQEVLLSLQSDEIVLRSLQGALEQFSPGTESSALREEAIAKCRELVLSCTIWTAKVALEHDITDKALQALCNLACLSPSSVPPSLRTFVVHLLAQAIWRNQYASYRETFIKAARELDTNQACAIYLAMTDLLLKGNDALAQGDSAEAIGYCRALLNTDGPVPLKVLGWELLSEAFHATGDTEREIDSLEQWVGLIENMSGGPCHEAIRAKLSRSVPALRGASRHDELLTCYSRLARHYESDTAKRPKAGKIYDEFVDWGLASWTEPFAPGLGSIRERLARLAGFGVADDAGMEAESIIVFEPKRTYGRIDREEMETLFSSLSSLPTGCAAAFLVHRVELRECHYRFPRQGGDPVTQFQNSLQNVLQGNESTLFCVRLVSAEIHSDHQRCLLLSHEETTRDIENLSFCIFLTPVGHTLDLKALCLYLCPSLVSSAEQDRLFALLSRDPEDLNGYTALESQLVRLLKMAFARMPHVEPSPANEFRYEGGFGEP